MRIHRNLQLRSYFRRWGVVIGFVIMFVIFSITSEAFFTLANMANIFLNISVIGIMTAGLTCLMATGNFDISTGWIASLAGVLAVEGLGWGIGLVPSLILGIAVGFALGAFNGLIVVRFGVPAFIGTLASALMIRGIGSIITGGEPAYQGMNAFFLFIGRGKILGVQFAVVIMGVVLVSLHVLLNNTRLGRYLSAIGSNAEASLESGVRVVRCRWVGYIICGMTAALSGIVLAARLGFAVHNFAEGFTLESYAVFFLGTTLAKEGRIHMGGTFIGSIMIGILQNGLNLLSVPYYYQDIATGAILIGCVALTLGAVRVRFEMT
jgi:ribose transport system permease protein